MSKYMLTNKLPGGVKYYNIIISTPNIKDYKRSLVNTKSLFCSLFSNLEVLL